MQRGDFAPAKSDTQLRPIPGRCVRYWRCVVPNMPYEVKPRTFIEWHFGKYASVTVISVISYTQCHVSRNSGSGPR